MKTTTTLLFTCIFLLFGCGQMMYLIDQKVINENEIPYQIRGKGPLLVFIHGGALDQKMWTPQVKALSKKFRVLTYDLRGHGDYDTKNNTGYEVDDLKGILDGINEDEIYLAGHSMGAMLATDFVLAYPERVKRLVLMSPPLLGYKTDRPELAKLLEEMIVLLEDGSSEEDKKKGIEMLNQIALYGPNRKAASIDPVVLKYAQESLKKHVKGGYFFREPILKNDSHVDQLSSISQPTLVLFGDMDYEYIKENAAKLKQDLPEARIHAIEGAAHLFSMEKPDEVNKLLLDFLQ